MAVYYTFLQKFTLIFVLAFYQMLPLYSAAEYTTASIFSEYTLEANEERTSLKSLSNRLMRKTWSPLNEEEFEEHRNSGEFAKYRKSFAAEINNQHMRALDATVSFITTAYDLDIAELDFNNLKEHVARLFEVINRRTLSGSQESTHTYLMAFLQEIHAVKNTLLELLNNSRGNNDPERARIYRAHACKFFHFLAAYANELVRLYFEPQQKPQGRCKWIRGIPQRVSNWRTQHRTALKKFLFGSLALTSFTAPIIVLLEATSSPTETSFPKTVSYNITESMENLIIVLHNGVDVISAKSVKYTVASVLITALAVTCTLLNELVQSKGAKEVPDEFFANLLNSFSALRGRLEAVVDRINASQRASAISLDLSPVEEEHQATGLTHQRRRREPDEAAAGVASATNNTATTPSESGKTYSS